VSLEAWGPDVSGSMGTDVIEVWEPDVFGVWKPDTSAVGYFCCQYFSYVSQHSS